MKIFFNIHCKFIQKQYTTLNLQNAIFDGVYNLPKRVFFLCQKTKITIQYNVFFIDLSSAHNYSFPVLCKIFKCRNCLKWPRLSHFNHAILHSACGVDANGYTYCISIFMHTIFFQVNLIPKLCG